MKRFAQGGSRVAKLAQYAVELVQIPVDVIFAGSAPATRAAVEATRAIPIVTVSVDPVRTSLGSRLCS